MNLIYFFETRKFTFISSVVFVERSRKNQIKKTFCIGGRPYCNTNIIIEYGKKTWNKQSWLM